MLPKKGAAYVDISASSLRSEATQSVSSDLILEFTIKRRLIYGLSYANAPESTVRCYFPQTFYTGLRLFN